jgi:uncharacterized protein YlxP (DUF503 family)
MRIGLCTVKIEIVDSFSLKEKRSVCLSIFSKLKSNFNVSVAETGSLNSFRKAEIAIVSVNTNSAHLYSIMSTIVEFIENDLRVQVEDYKIEII